MMNDESRDRAPYPLPYSSFIPGAPGSSTFIPGAPGSSTFCIGHSMPVYTFPKSLHIRSPADFVAVYAAKTREARGPVTVYAKPNDLDHPRLGMSVARRVGTAPRRNR